MKSYFNKVGKILLLSLLMVVVLPSMAFADGDIFQIIQAKMVSTVRDVRKIVYVIAGFGLVMFSVLAIFNKISFKHLAYIMISLSLLALMTPFINYFGGELEENDLDYGSFINDTAAQGGSPSYNASACEQTNTCPSDSSDNGFNYGGGEGGANGDGTGDGSGEGGAGAGDGVQFGHGEDDGDGTGAGDGDGDGMGALPEGPGIDTPGATTQNSNDGLATPGGSSSADPVTPEEEKKSFKERAQNFINGVGNFINNVGNTMDAIEHGKNAVAGAIAGAGDVRDIIKGDGNFFDKLRDVSNSIGNTTAGVGSDIHGALSNTGQVADYLGMEGASDALNNASDRVNDSQGNINDWTGMGNDVGNAADNAEYQWGRITGRNK